MSINIVGFSPTMKVPGFYAQIVYNAGPITIGDLPLTLLIVGNQLASGTAVPNQDINDIFSLSDADTFYGAGSEIDVMCQGALQIPGVKIKAAAVAEGGGAAAATASIIITGAWTTTGTFGFRVDGVPVTGTVLSTDTISTLADSIVSACGSNSHLAATAAKGGGPAYVVTLTRKSKGPRGNQGMLVKDITGLPSGCAINIAGGANTTIAAGSNAKVLPQATITTASVAGFPVSGTFYDATLATTITYTGTQSGAATTVAAGSDGVNVNTFVGAQTLNVASTAGYPSAGSVYLPTVDATVTYTGTGGTTFTGCTTINAGAGVIHTADAADGTLFTGCTGGAGTLATAQAIYTLVVAGPGIHFTGGTTVDNVTTLLGILSSDQYDRIAFAENDATNGALIKTWLNNQAGPLVGYLQHAVMANNAMLAASTTIAQTSLNAERIQYMWYLNSETIPSFIAATFAAYRTAVEQTDPDAAYDGYVLPGVVPQANMADWPIVNTLISALDNSITPIATTRTGGAYVVRSITTHSLDASNNPDYRTLDTSQAVVPDYVRAGLRLYWLTVFKPANPKVGPDPAPSQRSAPAGVATPSLWNRNVANLLYGWENQLILTNVANELPVSEFDPVARRIMSLVPVVAAFNNHATGVSVRSQG